MKRARNDNVPWITQGRLKELMSYDPGTGEFTRIACANSRFSRRHQAGAKVGSKGTNGYLRMNLDGRLYFAHRLAWLYVHGKWPETVLDHINGDKADNRLANLRDVSETKNSLNVHAARRDSKTGVRGVSPSRGRFAAFISCEGKRIPLGRYDTVEEASAAYEEAKRRLFPEVRP